MRHFLGCCVLLALLSALLLGALILVPGSADTLEMKDGRVISGKYLGGTQNQLRFLVEGKVEQYPADAILALRLGGGSSPLADAPTGPPPPRPDQWKIWSWGGDTPEWSRRLNLFGVRLGCNNPPDECVEAGNSESQTAGVTTYSIGLEVLPEHVPIPRVKDYALQFSQLSSGNSKLHEFSLDDLALKVLYPAYGELGMTPARVEALLNDVINKAKSANPSLKFGVTVYEYDLRDRPGSFLDDEHFPLRIRKKIDLVHLFIEYRMNGPEFAQDVQRAKDLFPNAKIIAGSYTYDRIDYKPCAQENYEENWWKKNPKARCTAEQEKFYFQKSLEVQARLLKQGLLEGIEFFPGFFGNEDQIPWNYYDSAPWGMGCLRSKEVCVTNTKAMSQIALATLNFNRAASRIVVRPDAPHVASGGRQQFTAVAVDTSGKPISPQPAFSWSVSRGGTISSSGVFTAGPTHEGSYTVTASAYGMSGTARVTVVPPAPSPEN